MKKKLTKLSDSIKDFAESCANRHFLWASACSCIAGAHAANGINAISKGYYHVGAMGIGFGLVSVGFAVYKGNDLIKSWKNDKEDSKKNEKNV